MTRRTAIAVVRLPHTISFDGDQAALLARATVPRLAWLAGVQPRTVRRWRAGARAPLALLRLLAFTRRGEIAALAGDAWQTFYFDLDTGAIRSDDWRAGITGGDVLELPALRRRLTELELRFSAAQNGPGRTRRPRPVLRYLAFYRPLAGAALPAGGSCAPPS